MINVEEIKNKIIVFLRENGPSLPITLSTAVQLSTIFTSAILSELLNIQKIKLSHLKIGASPLYFLPGQEIHLENFIDNLAGTEKSAYIKLKQSKILQDDLQEPAIRVALRSIKDFAVPFKFQEKLYWKYFTIHNNEVKSLIIPEKTNDKEIHAHTETQVPPSRQILKITKKQKLNPFIEQVKNFLIKKDIELLKELLIDKKEMIGKIRINSEFGKLIFLLIAKNKKKPQQSDITMAYQKAIEEKMPCYLLTYEEPSKKTLEFLDDYKNIVKVDKIK